MVGKHCKQLFTSRNFFLPSNIDHQTCEGLVIFVAYRSWFLLYIDGSFSCFRHHFSMHMEVFFGNGLFFFFLIKKLVELNSCICVRMSVIEKEVWKNVIGLVTNAKQIVSSVQDVARKLADYAKFRNNDTSSGKLYLLRPKCLQKLLC